MVRGTGYKQSMGNEAGDALPGIHNTLQRSTCSEVTFLNQPLNELIPTNDGNFLVELHGDVCIVCSDIQPVDGSRVLLHMYGMKDWGRVILRPERIVTTDGLILVDDLLDGVLIVGVVIYEIHSMRRDG